MHTKCCYSVFFRFCFSGGSLCKFFHSIFFLFINKVSFEMKWRCHHGSCLLFVGITFILPNNFYFWVGFVRNPTIEKGIKRCVTLGSFEHSFGDIQALVWVLSSSRWRQYSILNRFHNESRIPVKHHKTWCASFRIP